LSAIGADHGFPYFRAQGLIYRGWAKVTTSDFDDGVALIQQGISAWQATGALVWLPLFQGLAARAEAARDGIGHALNILAEALRTSREWGEHWFQAETLLFCPCSFFNNREAPAARRYLFFGSRH
jgi:predicted ATPase